VIRLAICWLGLPFLFFSASSGKLGTYILPCFPPLAILTSTGLLNYFAGERRRAFTVGVYTVAVIVAALVIVLLLHQTMHAGSRLYGQQETWKAGLVAIAFLAWVLFLHCAGRATDFRRKLAYFAIGPAVFMLCVHFAIPEQLMEKKTPGELLRQHKDRISQDTILVSDDYLAPAVCWSYKRKDVYLLDKAGEFAYGLGYDNSKHRLLDVDHLKELITENTGNGCVTLITFTKRYIEYEHLLPKPAFKDINHGFLFAEFVSSAPATTGSIWLQHAKHNSRLGVPNTGHCEGD
jgi:4-amino-4-deoxy-L-arabinose transferase